MLPVLDAHIARLPMPTRAVGSPENTKSHHIKATFKHPLFHLLPPCCRVVGSKVPVQSFRRLHFPPQGGLPRQSRSLALSPPRSNSCEAYQKSTRIKVATCLSRPLKREVYTPEPLLTSLPRNMNKVSYENSYQTSHIPQLNSN